MDKEGFGLLCLGLDGFGGLLHLSSPRLDYRGPSLGLLCSIIGVLQKPHEIIYVVGELKRRTKVNIELKKENKKKKRREKGELSVFMQRKYS